MRDGKSSINETFERIVGLLLASFLSGAEEESP